MGDIAPDVITEDIALALSDYERAAIGVGELAYRPGEHRARREMVEARAECEKEIAHRITAHVDACRADAIAVASFIVGWWPGLEDGLSWPVEHGHPLYEAAQRIVAHIEHGQGID